MLSLRQSLARIGKQPPIRMPTDLVVPFPVTSLRRFVTAIAPPPGTYTPGESEVHEPGNGLRPYNWTIEWNGEEGLDFDAYNCVLRAPYIQAVSEERATVLWRVGLPKGWDPVQLALTLQSKVWVAPADTAVSDGQLYQRGDDAHPLLCQDITATYKYEDGVRYNKPVNEGESDYWLNYMSDRPVLQFKVTFRGLKPGSIYHYRIESEGILDEDDSALSTLVLADDVYFKTAPTPEQKQRVSFLAMGDLGPGNRMPSYFYDVFDLFHRVAREHGPNLWLALGDIDNDTDGHPNAMDPFFFSVYNAYHNIFNPGKTSSTRKAKSTGITAFCSPPYYGLLGGLPVFPTFGNHDICSDQGGSLAFWNMAYKGSFDLPADGWCEVARQFNARGKGFFYTFRYGNVIFISLGLPTGDNCDDWREVWGDIQKSALGEFLAAIQPEISDPNLWVVAFFHDHHQALRDNPVCNYSEEFLYLGVDLVIAGHDHRFIQRLITDEDRDYHALVVGTGGFGDDWWAGNDPCRRPGFTLVQVDGNTLIYWKFDTHECDEGGHPRSRNALQPRIIERCIIEKVGLGKHVQYDWKIETPV